MWTLAAAVLLLATLAGAGALVRSMRRVPRGLVAPVALALVVCFESVALELLSVASAVTRAGVAIVHLAAVAAVLVLVPSVRSDLRAAPARLRRALEGLAIPGLLLLPLLALVATSALRYAPNNWDSMTYHLARVAHWIQAGSVAAYPTHIARQVVYGPGAEYLLLALQVVSGSDALAALVQLGCWLVLALSAPSLARLAGAPRRVAVWAAPIVASAPMLVLEASSTQNDLVAAVMTLAIVAVALPFRRRHAARARPVDWVILAAVCSAALTVKPLSLVAALPFLGMAAWNVAVAIVRGDHRGRTLSGIGAGLVVAACVAGPPTTRAVMSGFADASSEYLFPLVGEWAERGVNVVRGAAHHLPFPQPLAAAVGLEADVQCGAEAFCTKVLLRPHEDYAGNPVQGGLVLVLLLVGAARWRRLPPRARAALVSVVGVWFLFHVVVRENVWVSRIQTPLFALVPLALAGLARIDGARARKGARLATSALAAAALLVGYGFALQNQTRPPLGQPQWVSPPYWSYYANRSSVLPLHDAALEVARALRCDRLGLWIGRDSYDYPLTWRAMQEGIAVRHVMGADPWPCVVFADEAPPSGFEAAGWVPTRDPHLFVSATALSAAGRPGSSAPR